MSGTSPFEAVHAWHRFKSGSFPLGHLVACVPVFNEVILRRIYFCSTRSAQRSCDGILFDKLPIFSGLMKEGSQTSFVFAILFVGYSSSLVIGFVAAELNFAFALSASQQKTASPSQSLRLHRLHRSMRCACSLRMRLARKRPGYVCVCVCPAQTDGILSCLPGSNDCFFDYTLQTNLRKQLCSSKWSARDMACGWVAGFIFF